MNRSEQSAALARIVGLRDAVDPTWQYADDAVDLAVSLDAEVQRLREALQRIGGLPGVDQDEAWHIARDALEKQETQG